MDALIHDGWVQSIGGGLIATAIIVIGKWLLARQSLYRHAIFAIGVASVIFSFGQVLQLASQYLAEGVTPSFIFVTLVRNLVPGYLILGMWIVSLFSAIPTGFMVLRGRSFKQRVQYGAISGPIFLTIVDITSAYISAHSSVAVIRDMITWNYIYFCIISNFTGGVVGGFLIGALSHFYIEHSSGSKVVENGPATPAKAAGE
jgi:hypothetical protein